MNREIKEKYLVAFADEKELAGHIQEAVNQLNALLLTAREEGLVAAVVPVDPCRTPNPEFKDALIDVSVSRVTTY